MLNDILQQHWLSKSESKVYLASLELWTAPVSKIARKIEEWRQATHYVLETLVKKWLLKSIVMNKVTNYFAISPEELLEIQKWKIQRLMWAMPELMDLRNWAENKPKITLFEWEEWVKFLYQDTIKKEKSEIKTFMWYSNADRYLKRYLNTVHLKEIEKNNINAKILVPISMKKDIWYELKDNKNKSQKYTEIRYISDESFVINNEIDIYDENKVWIIFHGTNEMVWLLIQNKSIHDTLTSLFDLLWKNGKHDYSIDNRYNTVVALLNGYEDYYDSSFLYKWIKQLDLYKQLIANNPFSESELKLLDKLIKDSKFLKIIKYIDQIIDIESLDSKKSAIFLNSLVKAWNSYLSTNTPSKSVNRFNGKYIWYGVSLDMRDEIVNNFRQFHLENYLWGFIVSAVNDVLDKWRNNLYLFLWCTIWNLPDSEIRQYLINMTWYSSFTLLSYYNAPKSEKEIEDLINIYKSKEDVTFHKNGIAMLWLSESDFEYDVIYEKNDKWKTQWPFPWKIKWVIIAKHDINNVILTDWKKISNIKKIKAWQEFTIHYSRRFSDDEIEKLLKGNGHKIIFKSAWNGVSLVLTSRDDCYNTIEKIPNKSSVLFTLAPIIIDAFWLNGLKPEKKYEFISQFSTYYINHSQKYNNFSSHFEIDYLIVDYRHKNKKYLVANFGAKIPYNNMFKDITLRKISYTVSVIESIDYYNQDYKVERYDSKPVLINIYGIDYYLKVGHIWEHDVVWATTSLWLEFSMELMANIHHEFLKKYGWIVPRQ